MDKLPDEGRSAAPLHHRIAEDLRQRIGRGEPRRGDPLASEAELMARYRVSRGTVRQALASLRAERLVVGSRGKPPTVVGRRLTQPFSHLLSFSAWITSLGRAPSGRVIEFGPAAADESTAALLDLRPGGHVYRLVRVRLADGEPLMIERTTFPAWVGERVASLDLERQSIYQELDRLGIVFHTASQSIDAVAAPAADAALLEISPRAPLLRVRRHGFSRDGEPLEWSDDRYRGDRVMFAVDNSRPDNSAVLRLQRAGPRRSSASG